MKQNKFYSAAIAIILIGFFTTGWVSPTPAHHRTPVTITCPFTFDEGTFPLFPGTFTISGAFEASGDATMLYGPNFNGIRAHCTITLTDEFGTITIHEECQFASNPHKGRWEIVSGSGDYANLHGNGSLTMSGPDELEEDLVGFIY